MKIKLSQYAKKNKITYRTAWNHYKNGWVKCEKTPSGSIFVIDENQKKTYPNYVIYCRVSSTENKSNLDAQADRLLKYCNIHGYKVSNIIKEIGSGINDNRPKLQSILQDCTVDVIVVEHKDRLTRFGFNYIQSLLEIYDRKIEVVNLVDNEKEDLIQDFISIITSFCARIYGQRRNKRRIIELINSLKEVK